MTTLVKQRRCKCDRFQAGRPYHGGDCRECWLYHHDAYYRERRGGEGPPIPVDEHGPAWSRQPLTCRHLGAETRRATCPTCRGHVELKVFRCGKHGECTIANRAGGVAGCCADGCHEPVPGPQHITIDPARLLPGRCFNCGLIIHNGRRLLVYRKEWAQARCIIAELGDDWQPIANYPLYWGDGAYGQEDPRLFHYRGRLHVSYTSYTGRITSVGYVRLRDDFTVEAAFMPVLRGRREWEKNWVCFEHDDDLYAVYWSAPHTIIRINENRAERAYESAWSPPWTWGEMRGGCSPVRVGDEFYHFFHARMPQHGGTYSLGLYTFEAKPPFRPLRMIARPLVLVQPEIDRPAPGVAAVVFPGGSVLDGSTWRIAAGWLDAACRLYEFNAAELERELRPV